MRRTIFSRRGAMGAAVAAACTVALAVGLGAAAWAQPSSPAGTTTSAQFERSQGFNTVVINHVNDVMGTEMLPVGEGGGVEPGMFVTLTNDKLHIFDRNVASLRAGRPEDPTVASECRSKCSAVFFDAFARAWLEAAIESTAFAVEIPQRVLLAAHRDVPAESLMEVAYAASETRPELPPQLTLLVNNTRGSLRAQTFFLVPPEGIELRQGSAALGLTITVAPGRYTVGAADRRYARTHEVGDLARLRALAREIKKRYPSKETVILVPQAGLSLQELMQVASAVRESFPRMVLSAGQLVRI